MNKKTYLFCAAALFAACSFSGCNDDESIAPEKEIRITVSAEDMATKGSAITTSSFEQFGVDGYLTTAIAGKETHYINNGQVNKLSSGWTLYKDGTTPYAWASSPIAFWARAPYALPVTVASNYGSMSFDYELPEHTEDNADAELQEDIVAAYTKVSYADTEASTYTPGKGKVNFTFGHALAGIRLDVTNLASGWTVEKVTLSGIYAGGTCTVTPSTSGAPTFAWTLGTATGTYVQTLEAEDFGPATDEADDPTNVLQENSGKVFFIPPQTFPEGAKIILTLNDGVNEPFDVAASIAGKSVEIAKMNTYAVTSGFLEITLTGEVIDWDETEVSYATTDNLPQSTQFAVGGEGVQNVYTLHHTNEGKPYRQTWVLGTNTATVSFRIFSPAGGTFEIVPQGDTDKFTVTGVTGFADGLTGNISARGNAITKVVFTVTPKDGAAAGDKIWFNTYVTDTASGTTYSLDSETQLYDIRGYHYFQINDPLQ